MKTKLLSVFLLIVLLCSCSKPALIKFEPERYIDADFTCFLGDYEIEGNVRISSYEDIIFTFTKPEGLTHLTLRVSGEGYFADIGGSEDTILPEELPDNAPVKLFCEGLKVFLFQQNEFTKGENGTYFCEREILGEKAKATFAADGKITEIDFESINISLTASENTLSVG